MQKVYSLSLLLIFSILSLSFTTDKPKENKISDEVLKKNFKGIVEYVEYTPFDTVYYKVYISDGKIRVDAFDSKEEVNADKILIYDLKNQKIFAMKPSQQIYKTLNAEKEGSISIEGCEVKINQRNYRMINGYKCVQYRVINKIENTDVTYWIPEEDFPFYYQMVSMKHSLKRVHKYFYMLPNYQVAFPMHTVERTMLREEKSSYKVIQMNETPLSESIFTIPEGYVLNE
ncbi:MAG: DUF4412 domain-containing protein [Bacteroidales bacterium]|nr:DUF4412 domain-containing protein [Bacteroidales bacterium]